MFKDLKVFVNAKDVTTSINLASNPVVFKDFFVKAAGYDANNGVYIVSYKIFYHHYDDEVILAEGDDLQNNAFDFTPFKDSSAIAKFKVRQNGTVS